MSTKVRVLRHAGLGRPAGHADTPLDDQQAMLGLHQTGQPALQPGLGKVGQ